jgi:two-component system sensor histidine kinase BarA
VIAQDAFITQEKLPLQNHNNEANTSVDISLCLKLANNKPLLARDMLKMMLDGLTCEKAQINQAINDNNNEQLNELIHRLYGSSCYCGVPRLKNICGLLDKLMQARKVSETKEAIHSLNSAIDDVLAWGKNRDLNEVFGIN